MENYKEIRPEVPSFQISTSTEFRAALERVRLLDVADPNSIEGRERAAFKIAIRRTWRAAQWQCGELTAVGFAVMK